MELDVDITDGPAAFRSAIRHLGVRERATLHLLHHRSDAVIDLRDGIEALPFATTATAPTTS